MMLEGERGDSDIYTHTQREREREREKVAPGVKKERLASSLDSLPDSISPLQRSGERPAPRHT